MTVAELIEKLKDFDQETQVAAWDEYCDCIYIQKIFLNTITRLAKTLSC